MAALDIFQTEAASESEAESENEASMSCDQNANLDMFRDQEKGECEAKQFENEADTFMARIDPKSEVADDNDAHRRADVSNSYERPIFHNEATDEDDRQSIVCDPLFAGDQNEIVYKNT